MKVVIPTVATPALASSSVSWSLIVVVLITLAKYVTPFCKVLSGSYWVISSEPNVSATPNGWFPFEL